MDDLKKMIDEIKPKKLTHLTLPSGAKYYLKPTSYRGASAERIVSEIYQHVGITAPDTLVANLNGQYYAVTSHVFPPQAVVGEHFLKKIVPGGAQYALPMIFGRNQPETRVLNYFAPQVLQQLATHYALAFATKNWDANLGNLGFLVSQRCAQHLITLDFAGSCEPGHALEYANPFCAYRISYFEMLNYFKKAQQKFICRPVLAEKIRYGAQSIDQIVADSTYAGFTPDAQYVDELKVSMHNAADMLEI